MEVDYQRALVHRVHRSGALHCEREVKVPDNVYDGVLVTQAAG
jgi:hypothetical protein